MKKLKYSSTEKVLLNKRIRAERKILLQKLTTEEAVEANLAEVFEKKIVTDIKESISVLYNLCDKARYSLNEIEKKVDLLNIRYLEQGFEEQFEMTTLLNLFTTEELWNAHKYISVWYRGDDVIEAIKPSIIIAYACFPILKIKNATARHCSIIDSCPTLILSGNSKPTIEISGLNSDVLIKIKGKSEPAINIREARRVHVKSKSVLPVTIYSESHFHSFLNISCLNFYIRCKSSVVLINENCSGKLEWTNGILIVKQNIDIELFITKDYGEVIPPKLIIINMGQNTVSHFELEEDLTEHKNKRGLKIINRNPSNSDVIVVDCFDNFVEEKKVVTVYKSKYSSEAIDTEISIRHDSSLQINTANYKYEIFKNKINITEPLPTSRI